MEGSSDQIDLRESGGVGRVKKLAGWAQTKGLLQRPSTVVCGEWDGEGHIHIDPGED
jgi:hypothetical protein